MKILFATVIAAGLAFSAEQAIATTASVAIIQNQEVNHAVALIPDGGNFSGRSTRAVMEFL